MSLSGSEVIALSAVGVSGVGVVASLVFNFWNSSSERKERRHENTAERREWYNRTLFERRTKGLSEEYAWLMKLNQLRSLTSMGRNELVEDLRRNTQAAREWYDLNALYLFDVPPKASDFVGVLNAVNDLADGSFGKQLNEALQSHRDRARQVMTDWHGNDD